MRWLVTLVGVLASLEVYFVAAGQLALNAGIGFSLAAPLAGAWALRALPRRGIRLAGDVPGAGRELIFAYECLIIGSANALSGARLSPLAAAGGAAVLIAGQSLILWLAFRNPRVLRPVESPASRENLSARGIIAGFFYLAVIVVGCAIFVSRSGQEIAQPLAVGLQWPGIALLYSALGCLALGIASEHSKGSAQLYLAVAIVAASSTGMELAGRRSWYFLLLSLFAFFCLVPGWPQARGREPAQPAIHGASR